MNAEWKYVANISYGKDSLCMLDVIVKNNLPLDGIITCDVWFDEETPAYLPEVAEFHRKADKRIKEMFGFDVEHVRHPATYCERFHKHQGFAMRWARWCTELKRDALAKAARGKVSYIGYAIDEPNKLRQEKIKLYKSRNFEPMRVHWNLEAYPLAQFNVTEAQCYEWCKKNDLLAPTYANKNRDGCWFCFNSSVKELKSLYEKHPDYFLKLIDLEKVTKYGFKYDRWNLTFLRDLKRKWDFEAAQPKLF